VGGEQRIYWNRHHVAAAKKTVNRAGLRERKKHHFEQAKCFLRQLTLCSSNAFLFTVPKLSEDMFGQRTLSFHRGKTFETLAHAAVAATGLGLASDRAPDAPCLCGSGFEMQSRRGRRPLRAPPGRSLRTRRSVSLTLTGRCVGVRESATESAAGGAVRVGNASAAKCWGCLPSRQRRQHVFKFQFRILITPVHQGVLSLRF